MDTVLRETEGSHQLIGHIIDQVYKYDKGESQQLVDYMGERRCTSSTWDTAGIEVKGNQLTYVSGRCVCNDCIKDPRALSPEETKRHGAQFQAPLSEEWPGFEVLIQEIGDRHFIAIGVVPFLFKFHSFPGWEGNTAGYHVDDGRIFDRTHSKMGKPKGAIARRGDLLGCKMLFEETCRATGTVPVQFTINGRVIGRASVQRYIISEGSTTGIDDANEKTFYPFIGIGWEGIRLLFKMCSFKPAEQSQQKSKDDVIWKILDAVEKIREDQCDMRQDIDILMKSVKETQSRRHDGKETDGTIVAQNVKPANPLSTQDEFAKMFDSI